MLKYLIVLFIMLLPFEAYALDTGNSAPDFNIITIDGREFSFDRDIKGKKPLYLIFWATW
ncbi:MAG: hypothetical protein AB1632_07040 [Nitrospirota bacterium]